MQLAIGIFRVQAPQQELTKQQGRCQVPFQCARKNRLAEILLGCTPDNTFSRCKFEARFQEALLVLHAWAQTIDCVSISMERNGIGNVRHMVEGKKQVMCILWDGLELLAGKRGLTSQPNETVDAFGLRVMQASLVADLSEDVKKHVFFHEMQANETMCLPAGSFCIERILPSGSAFLSGKQASDSTVRKESLCLGFRLHYAELKESSSHQRLCKMVTKQKAAGILNDKYVQYWELILNSVAELA